MLRIETREGAVRFTVHAQPRASRTEIVGEHGEAVKIRLAAPPVEGAANAELVSFLAKKLGVPTASIRVVRGERGREKLVDVKGIDPDELRARLR
jgi:uncharacterized protein (TIGR00251 family)